MNVGLVPVQIKDHDPGLQRDYHMFTMPPRLGSRALLGAEATRGGCTLAGVASASPQEVVGYSSTIREIGGGKVETRSTSYLWCTIQSSGPESDTNYPFEDLDPFGLTNEWIVYVPLSFIPRGKL
jgi:hypothetical protein